MFPRKRKVTAKCSRCEAPAEYRGILHLVLRQHDSKKALRAFLKANPDQDPRNHKVKGSNPIVTRKITEPMCQRHYMENTFGLWSWVCTKKCHAEVQKKASVVLKFPEDMIVWLDMGPIFGGVKPKCPWCGKSLKTYDDGPV